MAAAAAGAVGFASLSAIAASPETVTLEDGSKTQKGAKPEDVQGGGKYEDRVPPPSGDQAPSTVQPLGNVRKGR